MAFRPKTWAVPGWARFLGHEINRGLNRAITCATRSWGGPAGGSPAQVRGSARLLASVARLSATAGAKRTQQS